MKKFLIRVSIFALLFFLFDKLFLLVRNYSATTEVDKRLEQVLKGELNTDILVMGSSRGARNVIASQMQDSLHISTYNLSYPGSNIEFHEYLLEQVLANKNKKPGIVVLVVDDMSELLENASIKFRLDRLYPLVRYKTVRNTLVEKGERNEWLSELFVLHQLSLSNFDIRKKSFTTFDTLKNCGSMPISFQSREFKGKYPDSLERYPVNKEIVSKRESYLKFVKLCNDHDIRLVIAFPPNFHKPSKDFEARLAQLAGNKAYVMHYNTGITEYEQADYYYDGGHLRANGAKIFTAELSSFIKKELVSNRQLIGKR